MHKRKNEDGRSHRSIRVAMGSVGLLILLGVVMSIVWRLTYTPPYQEPTSMALMASYEHMCDPDYSTHSDYLTAYPTQISSYCGTASYYRHRNLTDLPDALTQASIAGTLQARAMATMTAETAQAMMTGTQSP